MVKFQKNRTLFFFLAFLWAGLLTGQNSCPPATGITFSNVLTPRLANTSQHIGIAGFEQESNNYAVLAQTVDATSKVSLNITHLQRNGTVNEAKLWANNLSNKPHHLMPINCENSAQYLTIGHTGKQQQSFFLARIAPNMTTSTNTNYEPINFSNASGYQVTTGGNGTHFAAVGSYENSAFAVLGDACDNNPTGLLYSSIPGTAYAVTELKNFRGLSGRAPYYAITGQTINQTGAHAFLLIVNSQGRIEYNNLGVFNMGNWQSTGLGIVQADETSVTIVGNRYQSADSNKELFLMNIKPGAYNNQQSIAWVRRYSVTEDTQIIPSTILVNQQDNYVIGGTIQAALNLQNTAPYPERAFMMEIPKDAGTILWSNQYTTQNGTAFNDIRLTNDGGYFCTGSALQQQNRGVIHKIYTVKTDAVGRVGDCTCYQPISLEVSLIPVQSSAQRLEEAGYIQEKPSRFSSSAVNTDEAPCFVDECLAIPCQADTCIKVTLPTTSIQVDYSPVNVNCPNKAITYSPPSGTSFSCGVSTVTRTVRDIMTNEIETCTFKVIIKCEASKCCISEPDFRARVARGFRLKPRSCTVKAIPLALGDCDVVEWSWGDGTTSGTLPFNAITQHTYNTSGTYEICMKVKEQDDAGITCWEEEYCETVTVACDFSGSRIKDYSTTFLPSLEENIKLELSPNPIQDQVTIRYFVPNQGEIELALHNSNGQLINTIYQGNQLKGWHQTKFQAGHLSVGNYFIVLRTGQMIKSKKIIIQ